MSDYDQTVCKCKCHGGAELTCGVTQPALGGGQFVSAVRCCTRCPFCDKRIQAGRSNEHMRLCASADCE